MFNFKLASNLKDLTNLHLIKWGGSQAFLPLFIIFAFLNSLLACITKKITCIYVSDGLLSPLGYVLKILTGKPVVCNIHGRDIAFELKIYQIIVPWSLKRLDKVICVSQALKEECLKRGVPEKILHVIPNGIDVNDFGIADNENSDTTIEDIIGQKLTNQPTLLTVGRLVRKKGVDSFLKNIFPKILSKKPNAIYLIAGEGPLRARIQDIIKQNNYQKNVFLLGNVPMGSQTLKTIYMKSDVFVMPNVPVNDDMEGFGIVALEAGANALPVVASCVDGIAEAVQNGKNGFLIPHTNYEHFANTILNLLDNDTDRRNFGNHAKLFVDQNYSWSRIAKRYLIQFEHLT